VEEVECHLHKGSGLGKGRRRDDAPDVVMHTLHIQPIWAFFIPAVCGYAFFSVWNNISDKRWSWKDGGDSQENTM